MLRSILIGLDGSPHADRALELGLNWSKRFDASLIGFGIVDDPGIRGSEGMLLAEGYHRSIYKPLVIEARQHVEQVLKDFGKRCHEVGVTFRAVEATGTPYVQVLDEAQAHDLVILGQTTHFEYGWGEQDDETLSRVVKDSPRPIVRVPLAYTPAHERAPTLIAYDGSLPAAQALSAFVHNGLDALGPVHLLGIDTQARYAEQRLNRAVEFLTAHGIEARPHPIESSSPVAQVIVEHAHDWNAGLLVMGAYGQPVIREFFLGSVTKNILRECKVPILLNH